MVNFNYRVGLWGFLAGESVKGDGDLNAGLLDQRQLLRWVQDHVHKVRSPTPSLACRKFSFFFNLMSLL
jgi:hypothetical protein